MCFWHYFKVQRLDFFLLEYENAKYFVSLLYITYEEIPNYMNFTQFIGIGKWFHYCIHRIRSIENNSKIECQNFRNIISFKKENLTLWKKNIGKYF